MSAARIPLTVVGGYLGAGKTTFLNRLLRAPGAGRLAVLVNDFGAVAVDASLIERHDGRTLALANGCVCCSIGDDLAAALDVVADVSPRPDHVVLEASGVADPARIANRARGRGDVVVVATLVLADATDVRTRAADRFVGATVRRQLRAADLVALTHVDVAAADDVGAVETWLGTEAPGVAIARNMPTRGLGAWLTAHLDAGDPARDRTVRVADAGTARHHDRSAHDPGFRSLVWHSHGVIDRARLIGTIEASRPALRRAKGWLTFADSPDRAELVQVTTTRVSIEARDPPPSPDLLQLVVLDGMAGAADLRSRLDECATPPVPPAPTPGSSR